MQEDLQARGASSRCPWFFRAVVGRHTRWAVLGIWVAAAGACLPFALHIGSVESNDILILLPSRAQSTEVLRLERRFPSGNDLQAVVVFHRAAGLSQADRQAVLQSLARVRRARIPGTGEPSGVVPAPDGKVALFTLPVTPDQKTLVSAIGLLRRSIHAPPGVQVEVTGTAGFMSDLFASFAGVDLELLIATAALVVILLLITYQSPALWMVPLVVVALALVVVYAVAYGLAREGVTVTGENVGLLTVIVFGSGTDYALLLTARYKEELRRRHDRRTAMALALRGALPSIAASAATVAAALACLGVAGFNVTRSFGLLGAMGIGVSFLAMVTAYPALLVACSRRVFWPRIPREGHPEPAERGVWASIAKALAANPRRYWVASGALLAALGIGLVTVNTSVTTLDDLPATSSSVRGARLLFDSFPAGLTAPVDVVVTDPSTVSSVRAAIARAEGGSSIGPAERAGNLTRFEVVPGSVPSGSKAFAYIRRLRVAATRASHGTALVGGQTAQDYDLSVVSRQDERAVVPLVLAVVLLVLLLLLRAVVGPLAVLASVVLSLAAALGTGAAMFTSILGFPGVDPTVPLLSFVFLVALGVDYNVFLLGRISQEVRRHGTSAGVVQGLAMTGSVLTSAGVILAGTFSVLVILPLLPSKEIGLVVAFGVLLDTLLVRTILVPALAIDLGRAFWWPRGPARPQRRPATR
jgi:RND superfamily putative drug exporter